MSNKPRPMDGPGANGLRGGRNVYCSGKTAIGVWLDEKGGPSGYKRGFHTEDYSTEAQVQQQGALQTKAPYFGSELPNPEHLHRKPPKMGDLFDPLYSGEQKMDYQTCSRLLYSDQSKKFEENHLPRSNMPREELENYQKTWCSDTPAFRAVRYQTENRRAGNAANKNFQTPSVRLMPGTPIILEQFRAKLIEKYGVLAVPILKHLMGKGENSCAEWKAKMAQTEIKLFPHELNQILAYFTPTNSINVDRFVSMVVARSDGFDADQPKTIFNKLFGAGERTTTTDVLARMNADAAPEVVAGFADFGLGSYVGDDDCIGVEEFTNLHRDIHSTTPVESYKEMVALLWS